MTNSCLSDDTAQYENVSFRVIIRHMELDIVHLSLIDFDCV